MQHPDYCTRCQKQLKPEYAAAAAGRCPWCLSGLEALPSAAMVARKVSENTAKHSADSDTLATVGRV